jgi:FMN-dependent NADH-azoreductase
VRWIDSFTPEEGYNGLVIDKPLVAVYARGGAYRPGSGAQS